MALIPRKVCMLLVMMAAICSVTCAAQRPDQCRSPQYKIADRRTTGKTSEVDLSVSIDPMSVNLRNLFAIACQLKVDFPGADLMRVDIFNNFAAAKRSDPIGGGDPGSRRNDSSNYIASYYLDHAKHEEHLVLWGDIRNCASNVIIDLPSKRPRSACDY